MDQTRTPLIDALHSFSISNQGYFNIPGHRGARGVDARLLSLFGERVFEADRTETDGLDDLHAADGVIKEAQELAADLYGSDYCRFVVNGTTGANEAMILAAAGPGEKILVPRNAHKSVMMGLIMSGAVPVWILPEREKDTGLYGAVSPERIEEMLEQDSDIRAVFLVSPTYYGTCSDLKKITGIAHKYGIPVLVDEAHGAHFAFHDQLPPSGVSSGADLVAQSTHKTPGSMTQSAMLHICGDLISLDRVDDALKLVQSTSPSYVLMASLDGTRHLMAEQGNALQARAMKLAALLREELQQIPGIEVFHEPASQDTAKETSQESSQDAAVFDPCRVVISPCGAGMTGTKLQKLLFGRHITTELADSDFLVLVVTHGNTEGEILRLSAAVREIVTASGVQEASGGQEASGVQEASGGQEASGVQEASGEQTASGARLEITSGHISEMVLTPREAWFAEKKTVLPEQACGLIAGEAVTPYPPGIPLIYPGERITPAFCEQLMHIRELQIPVHDAADPEMETIRVIYPKNI